jgi:hypothetical protein
LNKIFVESYNKNSWLLGHCKDIFHCLYFDLKGITYELKIILNVGNTHQIWSNLITIFNYRYSIKTNEEDRHYNVDLGLSVCYTDTKPCDYSVSILTNTVIDHKLCDPDADLLNSGKDYSILISMNYKPKNINLMSHISCGQLLKFISVQTASLV